ncbi:hypothetical protein HZA39_02090 [Candidatus Peregrinibacteria bacterium]|nr:hypothetical protein [Candidatus Peregrinibacteria bacterium]
MKRIMTALLILSLAFTLSACKFKDDTPQVTASLPEIEAADQKIADNKVIIDKASIPVNGWLVIHEADPIPEKEKQKIGPLYKAGKILGYVYLPAGPHTNIEVKIAPTQKKKLIAAVYVDKGQKGILDVPGEDHPYYINLGALYTIFSLM